MDSEIITSVGIVTWTLVLSYIVSKENCISNTEYNILNVP